MVSGRSVRVLVVLVFTVGLCASVLLPLNSEYQQGLATAGERAARPVSLTVALVNEDRGVEADGRQVNLGRAYVKQIESDTSVVWRVVSRGVAESGLAQGSYHVLVLIPPEFSAKVLDLEAQDPGQIGITYQVNGNGDARVESAADAQAREIVGRLNGQLVDMYMASILGNLRQAQENVRLVADAEAGHVGVLVEEVDPAARAIGAGLSVLEQGSEGSVAAHLGLVDGLDGLGADLRSGVDDATAHDGSLGELLSAREEGALTYGAFLESLLATDARLLGDEVQDMYDELVATSGSLRGQLAADDGGGSHTTAVELVRELTGESEASVAGRAGALDVLNPDRILEEYGVAVRSVIGADEHGALTLADVLRFAQERGSTSGSEPEFVPWLAKMVAARIAVLPYRSQAALDAAADEGVFEHAGGRFADVAPGIAQDLDEIMTWAGHADVPVSPDGVVGGDLDVVIADLLAALPSEPDPDPSPAPEPGQSADPTAVDGDPGHPAEPVPDVAAPAARYGATLARVAAAYAHAAGLVRLAHGCATSCGLPADADVGLAVDAVITMAVEQQIAAERQHLVGAGELTGRMVRAADELAGSLALLRTTRETLSENVTRQLASLADLRASMARIREGERTAARSVAESDALTRSVASEARALLGTSGALAASAVAGADDARRVAELMHGLRSDVDLLLGDAADLDEQSDRLTQALVGQVDDSQAFADSFSGVLSNAHSAGVLNERLLRFLVEPVEPQGREPVVSADVTRPFPWVLIMFSVCFVSGYLVSGVTDGRRQRSAFARTGAQWLAPNARALGTASLVGALLGLGLAWASGTDLGVPRESQLTWSAAVVLSAVGLTVLAHGAVRQLRSAGVGLCLLALVGYVFVSDAVGAGVRSGLSAAVSAVNPLSHAEATLSAVLGGDAAGFAVVGRLLLVLAVAAVLDLLVQDDLRRLLPRRRGAVPA